jgi:hypothetical protein
MNSARFEQIITTRSFLFDLSAQEKEDYERFANCVLRLLPGQLDLNEVVSLRRYPYLVQRFPRFWDRSELVEMQFKTKPVAGREFCLLALALAMDAGVDLHGPRLEAIMLSLHSRVGAKSELRTLGSDIVMLIANMSLC